MVFSSLEFIFFFLPITLLAYFSVRSDLRNVVLLLASLLFYTWGAGSFVGFLLLSVAANFWFGLLCDEILYGRWKDKLSIRFPVFLSAISNIALLGYFKYSNFFVGEFNTGLQYFGYEAIEWLDIALPIGISFFTFQSMSYTFDIARGDSRALRNPLDFCLYVALFPQLIAGPIVRYHLVEAQLRNRESRLEDLYEGATRFIYGVCKKVILADPAGLVADACFGLDSNQATTTTAWLGALSYTIQIYFDFSAYSDMAIGLGRVFGFKFPENFNRPYSAISVTDFWRRWHMTLSNFFRDYVYIPLGGSKGISQARVYMNLSIVFLLTGIWHGANWTFIVWGIFHGALLVIERIWFPGRLVADGSVWLRRAVTMFAVVLGWVVFRADSLSQAHQMYSLMLWNFDFQLPLEVRQHLTSRTTFLFLLGLLCCLLPRDFSGYRLVVRSRLAVVGVLTIVFPYAALQIFSGTFSPFLYFRF